VFDTENISQATSYECRLSTVALRILLR